MPQSLVFFATPSLRTSPSARADKATIDADGDFWFVGRDDDVINTGGHLVGAFEVESALLEHPAVAESAAVAKPDPVNTEVVKAAQALPGEEVPDPHPRRAGDPRRVRHREPDRRARGADRAPGVVGRIDVITTTLGKALGGASGGCVSDRGELVEMCRQRARPYLFSNTVAPVIVAGALLPAGMRTWLGKRRMPGD